MVTLVQLRVIDAVHRHGSVTAAGKELCYTQPAISHHLSRLESQLGAQLLQRVGRGIRLTPAGRLLADRAAEIIGRVDSATTELSTLVGLDAGRVRLAGFNSVMSSLVPQAGTVLAQQHPGLQLGLTDTHPEEALQQLRTGHVDVAVIFRYDTTPEDDTVRLTHLLDDPLYLLTISGGITLADHADTPWIAGCERCRSHLVEMCLDAGFSPNLAYTTDDMVVMQSLVAAGMGVTTIPGLALRAHRHPAITATRLPTPPRRIYAATYGEPPDPPATAALLDALTRAATTLDSRELG
ncbi:LysR family transcriptional regulator [Plantactinospora sp. S1510]|uniref:LysR family transcriptional regulator n=1 Tax=Plantactinospora alkalitolerans TaxID=2789879 RepID=A0ABS0GVK8_9ACTN|nr:LysR family transcriptional regulator [Plantactinospora alkalitolerans]MBF9130225.1 LysR family transcriptional regulator [Plantactinospora alkalitolerans]